MNIQRISAFSAPKFNNKNFKNVNFKSSMEEHLSQGARFMGDGTRFTLQAPLAQNVSVLVSKNNNYDELEMYNLRKDGDKFTGLVRGVKPGDKYKYVVSGKYGKGYFCTYDPRADFLPNDIEKFKEHSDWGEVINHDAFVWSDEEWMKKRAIKDERGWHLPDDMVMETIHMGLLGGFKSAKKEIDKIAEKKIADTVRIMPVGEFYGSLNWGYDEVGKYAPENAYGRPEDFKDFINYAHSKNIRVILDIVPNHFGPIGSVVQNLMPVYSWGETPWGKSLEFNGENGKYMKSYMTDMMVNWAKNYHIDGFRLDATHYMNADDTIKDINYDLRSHKETEDLILYVEDMRLSRVLANEKQPKVINEKNWGYNGLTNFDFYKALLTLSTGIPLYDISPNLFLLEHVYRNGIDKSHEEKCINDSKTSEDYKQYCRKNLTYPDFTSKNLLINISNHDEIGNQAGGKRNLVNILSARLGMVLRADNNWQGANYLLFEMIKHYLKTGEVLSEDRQRQCGCKNPVSKETFKKEFECSFALNKLVIGATLLHLSPKEFFMGDDEGELAPFKFFANYETMQEVYNIANEKGYMPDITAFKESRMGEKYSDESVKKATTAFTKDFLDILKRHKIMTECTKDNLVTYIHNDANILELKYWKPDGTELIAVMNFSGNPQENFHLRTTAPDTKLKEAINSNSSKYRGTNWFMNCQNNELSAQKVLVPPHSIVVFEK